MSVCSRNLGTVIISLELTAEQKPNTEPETRLLHLIYVKDVIFINSFKGNFFSDICIQKRIEIFMVLY